MFKEIFNNYNETDGVKLNSLNGFVVPGILSIILMTFSLIHVFGLIENSQIDIKENENKIIEDLTKKEFENGEILEDSLINEKTALEIRKEMIKELKESKKQKSYGVNMVYKDFFRFEFLKFLKVNDIGVFRLKMADYLNTKSLIAKYMKNEPEFSITLESVSDITFLKRLNDDVKVLEAYYKDFGIEGLKTLNTEIKKYNIMNKKDLKVLVVGNKDELEKLYEEELGYLFDIWGVYELKNSEDGLKRLLDINYLLYLNNDNKSKKIYLIDFETENNIEFIKKIQRIGTLGKIFFRNYKGFEDTLKKAKEQGDEIEGFNKEREKEEKE